MFPIHVCDLSQMSLYKCQLVQSTFLSCIWNTLSWKKIKPIELSLITALEVVTDPNESSFFSFSHPILALIFAQWSLLLTHTMREKLSCFRLNLLYLSFKMYLQKRILEYSYFISWRWQISKIEGSLWKYVVKIS